MKAWHEAHRNISPLPGLSEWTLIVIYTPRGHSIVKKTGGWLDSLGSGILVGKDILGFFKNCDLDNSQGVAKMIHIR